MKIENCPGLLKERYTGYCPLFLRKMFNGKKVSHILPYHAPENDEEDQERFMQNRKRISISGMQEKYSVLLDKNNLRLTEGKEQGTYILKPRPHGLKNVYMIPANEHVTMQIAKQVYKIETAENGMVFFKNDQPAYLTKRFDIDSNGKKSGKEDFASLAGKSEENAGVNFKYDYSYEGIARLIKKYVGAWKIEIEKFYRLVIFNFLFSNGDAHLKNFSLLETINGDYILSPAYDLLNTRIHVDEEGFFALHDELFKDGYWSDSCINNSMHHPCKEDFIDFGKKIGIPEKRVFMLIAPFFERQTKVEKLVEKSFLDAETKNLYLSHYNERLSMLNS
ncbi:MAG: HipA domain-containing protein [Prolixibacteraceae bacterium]|nr:HipA domain-containing protein [Prolixibacteraceae bacterium]